MKIEKGPHKSTATTAGILAPRYRMLLWEQSRTAGVLCVFIGMLAVLLLLMIRTTGIALFTSVSDVRESALTVVVGALLLASLLLIVRQDAQAHLALDFEPRLLRLPISTAPLAAIVFLMRLLFLSALGIFLYAAHGLLFGPYPPVGGLVAALHLLLWAQALSWTRRSITGMSYFIPFVLLMALVLLSQDVLRDDATRLFSKMYALLMQYTHPSSLLSSLPAAFLLAMLGVSWERRDERHGLPEPGKIFSWLRDLGATKVRYFAAPFDAQLWYERRRIGRWLPILTVLFTLLFAMVALLFPKVILDDHTRLWYAPYFGLLVAALVAGPVGLRPRDSYPASRPQTFTTISMAVLLIQLRGLFVCFLLVALLSLLGMLLSGYDGVLLVVMLAEGDMTLVEASLSVLRPAFAVTVIAWALLWITTLPMGIMMLLATAHILLKALYLDRLNIVFYRISDFMGQPEIIILVPLIVAGVIMMYVLYRRLLSAKQLLAGLAIWQNIILLLLIASPYVGAHHVGVIFSATIATIVMLPVIGVLLSFNHRLRSR